MNCKNILFICTVCILVSIDLFAANTNPEVTNVAFTSSGNTVTVTYDVYDLTQSTVTINLFYSVNGGSTWTSSGVESTVSGDYGPGILTETGRSLTFTFPKDSTDNFKVKIYAIDEIVDGNSCGKVYYGGGPNNDSGGDYYNTIEIGSQCWLKENLNVGDPRTRYQTDNDTIERYCYSGDLSNCETYGALYDWGEAVQYENDASNTASPDPAFSGHVQGICPTGWHIPTKAELLLLKNAVDGDAKLLREIGQGTTVGGGTNISGFSDLLSGLDNITSTDANITLRSYHWSSDESSATKAMQLQMHYNVSNVYSNNYDKTYALSVRCLKD